MVGSNEQQNLHGCVCVLVGHVRTASVVVDEEDDGREVAVGSSHPYVFRKHWVKRAQTGGP